MIPVHAPVFSGNEKAYLTQCIDDGWVSSEGPFVERFERSMAQLHSRTHGIALANGTAALEVALRALGIGPEDEVILPTFTIISCAQAVVKTGATPVLVDCCPLTWNMRTDEVLSRITSKTRAIMLVHIYGLPVDLEPIVSYARSRGILIIEDCAELLGQTYKGKPVGSWGDLSTYSFYANKHVTCGEGGMILCDSDEINQRTRSLRNLCFEAKQRFVHNELGWNYRMSNLQAALGLAQFEQLDQTIARKRALGAFYTQALANCEMLQLPLSHTSYAENIYWIYGVLLRDHVPFDAAEAMRRLKQRGVETRPFFWCMHEQPVLRKLGLFAGEAYPIAERLARRGFYIPMGLGLTDEQLAKVTEALHAIF